ncbi:hypothetical protein X728_14890 [Mesorhizobium sp. L103C120A0]|nr:hypothetical protein X728_14890 [Mesorhizobium sp. L103C120A0]
MSRFPGDVSLILWLALVGFILVSAVEVSRWVLGIF